MVSINSFGPVHIREVCPKDFYMAQIIRSKEGSLMPLLNRLIKNKEILSSIPAPVFRSLVNWTIENIFTENILTVENWLEIGFHLCKQRWDQSMDWLESQPMSKVKAMIDIYQSYVEDQNDQMKRT